jgi:hypothetical protein
MDRMFDEDWDFSSRGPWHQDQPQRPKVWGDETPSKWWGPMSRGTDHGGAGGGKELAGHSSAEPATPARAPAGTRARVPAAVSARKRQAQKTSRGTTKPRR